MHKKGAKISPSLKHKCHTISHLQNAWIQPMTFLGIQDSTPSNVLVHKQQLHKPTNAKLIESKNFQI